MIPISDPDASPATPVPYSLPPLSGIGLKSVHYTHVLDDNTAAKRPSWVEVHPQNYFGDGGPAHRWLTAIAGVYPLSFHSVGLSLGSADGLNRDDLENIAVLPLSQLPRRRNERDRLHPRLMQAIGLRAAVRHQQCRGQRHQCRTRHAGLCRCDRPGTRRRDPSGRPCEGRA